MLVSWWSTAICPYNICNWHRWCHQVASMMMVEVFEIKTDARKAGSAKSDALSTPVPPCLTGNLAWCKPSSVNVTFNIACSCAAYRIIILIDYLTVVTWYGSQSVHQCRQTITVFQNIEGSLSRFFKRSARRPHSFNVARYRWWRQLQQVRRER